MRITSTGSTVRAALLIDADNFNEPKQLQAIHSQFGQHAGKGFICHVHGDPKRLYHDALKPIWQELAVRLMPCLPLNKNTTDAGLIVDALMLHFQQGVQRFGIASGDADFAPLSLQLRELGCEVWCFARKSIAFEAMVGYYDHVVRFDVPPLPPAEKGILSLAVPPALSMPVEPTPTPVISLPSLPVAMVLQKEASRNPEVSQVTAAKEPRSEDAASVRQILKALPPWHPHTIMQLNQLGAPLRDAGLKKSKTPLHSFFRKYPAFFTVLPMSGAPKQVRLEKLP